MTKKEYEKLFSRKHKNGYKVFRITRNGKLSSCVVKGKAKVCYESRKSNYAPKWLVREGRYLTYFKDLDSAITFKSSQSNKRTLRVFFVYAKYPCKELPGMFEVDSLKEGRIHTTGHRWPLGTRMARNIIPLQKISIRGRV